MNLTDKEDRQQTNKLHNVLDIDMHCGRKSGKGEKE